MSEATKAYYAKHYSGGYNRKGGPVIVPDNVERHDEHVPCFRCGQARGCRHREAA